GCSRRHRAGRGFGEAALDNNGIETQPVPIRVRVTIRNGEMHVDTTGTAPQQIGPVNSPLPSTVSAARLVMKMIMAPHYDANEGFFRPLRMVVPQGSLLNPTAPAPVFLYGWASIMMGEALFKALAMAAPQRAVARSGGDLGGLLFSGFSPEDGTFYAGGADESCGQGAAIDQDGESATIHWALGESRNVPAEIIEERYPILVERYELWQDSGGAGRFRGGLGVRKYWRALADMKLIAVIEQTGYPAYGLEGGQGSWPNALVLSADSPDAKAVGKIAGYMLKKDARLQLHMGGGGGWGSPLERDPEAVLRDVTAEYVSVSAAERDYGVVIQSAEGRHTLDKLATQSMRASRSQAAMNKVTSSLSEPLTTN
ncbi:MAG: hydantoinase B/oxoprolinase family protein, partial [Gammaproteobacteria bacterium]